MSEISDLIAKSNLNGRAGQTGQNWLLSQLGAAVLVTNLPSEDDLSLAAPEIQLAQRLYQRVEHNVLEILCGTSQQQQDDRYLLGIEGDTLEQVLLRALRFGMGYPDDIAQLLTALIMREHATEDLTGLCQALARKYEEPAVAS